MAAVATKHPDLLKKGCVGLAMDYCVGYTSLHSLELGYPTTLLKDMTRPVKKKTGDDMLAQVIDEGGQVTTWNSWRNELDDWQRAKDVAEFFIANSGVVEHMYMTTIVMVLVVMFSM